MLDYFIQTAIAFFAVIGICEIALQIKNFFNKKSMKAKNVVLLLSLKNEDSESIEWIIRSAITTAEEICFDGKPEIVILNDNLKEEALKVCEILKKENDEIVIINKERMKEKIDNCFT